MKKLHDLVENQYFSLFDPSPEMREKSMSDKIKDLRGKDIEDRGWTPEVVVGGKTKVPKNWLAERREGDYFLVDPIRNTSPGLALFIMIENQDTAALLEVVNLDGSPNQRMWVKTLEFSLQNNLHKLVHDVSEEDDDDETRPE